MGPEEQGWVMRWLWLFHKIFLALLNRSDLETLTCTLLFEKLCWKWLKSFKKLEIQLVVNNLQSYAWFLVINMSTKLSITFKQNYIFFTHIRLKLTQHHIFCCESTCIMLMEYPFGKTFLWNRLFPKFSYW